MTRFVLDASVTLAWFLDHPTAPYAERIKQLLLQGSRAFVPALWSLEIANGFMVAERREIFTPNDSAEALRNLDMILAQTIEIGQDVVPVRRVLATAREFGLTAYDAAYLDAARVQQLPLATLDRQLKDAAVRASVSMVR